MTNTANKPLDWYAERTAYLTEFMSEERRQVLQRTLDSRTRYMTILTENTYHAQNASAWCATAKPSAYRTSTP